MGDAAVERHMIACVNESLSLYLMSNARFMCERLVAEFPSEVRFVHLNNARAACIWHPTPDSPDQQFLTNLQANTFLLATCCYRSDQAHRAYHLLMGELTTTALYQSQTCWLIAVGLALTQHWNSILRSHLH